MDQKNESFDEDGDDEGLLQYDINGIRITPMQMVRNTSDNQYLYSSHVPCQLSGRYGFSVRVMPAGNRHLQSQPGLITWY